MRLTKFSWLLFFMIFLSTLELLSEEKQYSLSLYFSTLSLKLSCVVELHFVINYITSLDFYLTTNNDILTIFQIILCRKVTLKWILAFYQFFQIILSYDKPNSHVWHFSSIDQVISDFYLTTNNIILIIFQILLCHKDTIKLILPFHQFFQVILSYN